MIRRRNLMAAGALVDMHGRPMTASRDVAFSELQAEANKYARLRASYDAAQTTKENARHWRFADDLSAAAANSLTVRRTLRTRSRYECLQSNAFGRGIVNTLATDFVSTGPRLQLDLPDRALAGRIESEWNQWTRAVRLNKKLRTARLSKCVDGETFLIAVNNERLRGPIQLDIRGIEADQISTPGWIDGQAAEAVDGIRFDKSTGDAVEYDLLNEHPGDRGQITTSRHGSRPLDARDVIHLFNADRPGQARGVPELTPSLPLFAFLRRFTLAVVMAAETAADFAAVLKTQVGAFEDQADGERIFAAFEGVDIDRGMMATLPYGYELQQFKAEHPTTTYTEFRNALLAEIARPVNMPKNKVLGDSSGYNYSSARMDHQVYYHGIEVERGDWDIEALDRIFEWWLDEALLVGLFELPTLNYVAHRWTWPQAPSVNPLQDAQTSIKLIEAGLLLEEDYLHERQMDPETFFARRRAQDERRIARVNVDELVARAEESNVV